MPKTSSWHRRTSAFSSFVWLSAASSTSSTNFPPCRPCKTSSAISLGFWTSTTFNKRIPCGEASGNITYERRIRENGGGRQVGAPPHRGSVATNYPWLLHAPELGLWGD